MFNFFKIERYFRSISDITPEILKEDGIKAVISDLDNTLVKHNQMDQTQQFTDFVGMLNSMGIGLALLSNNNNPRVRDFLQDSDIPYFSKAGKPMVKGYLKALEALGAEKHSAVMLGDQIFTDLWGANRAGIKCYLVEPVDISTDSFGISIKRKFERFFVRIPAASGQEQPAAEK